MTMSDVHSVGRSGLMVIAGVFGATAVALGAFHAHGMEEWLAIRIVATDEAPAQVIVAKRMETCETGLKYHLVHAAALLALAMAGTIKPSRFLSIAGGFMTLGTILFSGSLYAIAFLGISKFGAVAPLGGLSLIISWLLVAGAGLRR